MKKIMIMLTAAIMLTSAAFAQQKLDAQGHRGGMALMPENTIQSMLNGVKLGLRTLELDVVISKDGQAVVSHDAYMSSVFMRKPDGSDITKEEEKSLILYQMTYSEIHAYDSGSKPYPSFPEQAKIKTYKPLLSDLIDSVEAYTKKNHLKPVYYNIETKISPAGDGVYNPAPQEFLKVMMGVLNKKNISKRLIIQSFDVRTLQILHKTQPEIKLSLLAFGKPDVIANFQKQGLISATDSKIASSLSASAGGLDSDLKNLGFTPDIYSPYYTSVTKEVVDKTHAAKMLILPWTVDQEKDMIALGEMGVDGIISNCPDKLVKLFGNYQSK